MKAAVSAVVLALSAAIMLAAGYVVGGQTGLLAVVALATVAALLTARLRIPAPARRPPSPQPEQDPGGEFAAYRRIENALGQAQVSRRHFDHAARPLLQRLLAVLLADRRRVDIAKDTGAARAALGDDLWPLLDPARPVSEDSRPPGISEQTIARIADRLEDL
jgi:hypothetical protein